MPLEMLWFTNACEMQDLTSGVVVMIYSRIWQSYAINFNFWVNKRISIKTHMLKHSLLQQDETRFKKITRLEF
jgi:hypothetical protein